jgi:hypothetical protein
VTPPERGTLVLPGRLPAMLIAAGVAVAALAIGVPWPMARAADPTAATVAITSLDPLVPTATGTLRLAGQVTNSGSASVNDVQIRLRISTTPLIGRSDITSVATGTANVQGQLVNLTLPDSPRYLDPGGQANWSISVPLLDLPIAGVGVYVLVVEAVGTLNGTYQQLGVERTFLPWVPKPSEVQPSRLVWLWPLSEPPGSAPDGVMLSDQIATDLGPTGRLTELVSIGGSAQGVVSWVADPQVLESAAGLSGGYRYNSGSGVREGRGATAAAAWLSAADLALAAGDVHTLPYAWPDADALVRATLDHDLVATLTLGQQLLSARIGRDSGPPVYWPTSGISERRTLDVLDSAGVKTVVLSSNTAHGTEPAVHRQRSDGPPNRRRLSAGGPFRPQFGVGPDDADRFPCGGAGGQTTIRRRHRHGHLRGPRKSQNGCRRTPHQLVAVRSAPKSTPADGCQMPVDHTNDLD